MSRVWMTHNPNCGTSRNVLALLRERGIEPDIREYLKQPLTEAEIAALVAEMNVPARDLVRWSEPGSSGRSRYAVASEGPSAPANAAAGEAREAGFRVADLVRWKERDAVALAGISELSSGHLAAAYDDALIRAMAEHPVLLNRPIVRTGKGTKLCRPSETVEALL